MYTLHNFKINTKKLYDTLHLHRYVFEDTSTCDLILTSYLNNFTSLKTKNMIINKSLT